MAAAIPRTAHVGAGVALLLFSTAPAAHAGQEGCYGGTCWPRCYGQTCDRYDYAQRERERELQRKLRDLRNQWLHRGEDPSKPY